MAKLWRLLGILALALLLVACRPAPIPATATGGPATPAPSASPPAVTLTAVNRTPAAPSTSTPAPAALTLCLAREPASLYAYARPEPARAHVLAALYDSPIDAHAWGFEPVLLERLPSLAAGDAVLDEVLVQPGELVVDALGRVLPLAEGLPLLQADGSLITHSGGAARLPQLTATFRLRPGVLWSDGTPLTAADSVFAFELGRSPESHDPQALAAQRTASYQALDALTVRWTGLPGYLDAHYNTHFWAPLPGHRFAGLRPSEIADSIEANRAPLGWGPFVVSEWVAGDRLVLARNDRYWRAPEGLPRLERLIYRFFPDRPAFEAAVQSGACDIVPSATELETLAGSGPLTWQAIDGNVLELLSLALQPAENYAGLAATGLLGDARVRQALAHCLDRAALAPYPALASPPAAYLPAGHPSLAPAISEYALDPARGRALLAEAGWEDRDGDGVLDRDGVPLRFTLAASANASPAREALLAGLQSQWLANCGVGVEARRLTRGELEGDWPDGVVFGRRFDVALLGWRVGPTPPCALFVTAQIPAAANPGGANAGAYANPEFDRACWQALGTLDQAQSAAAHAEAQRLFAQDLPALPLFFRPRFGAARPGVTGYVLDGSSVSELWNVERIGW